MESEQPRRYNFRARKSTPVTYTDSSSESSPETSREPTPEPSPAASPVASPEVEWEASPGGSPVDTPEESLEASPEASPEPSPRPSTQPSVQYAAGTRTRAATRTKKAKKATPLVVTLAVKPEGVTKSRKPTRVGRGKARAKAVAGPAIAAMEEEAKANAGPAKKEELIMIGGPHELAKQREVNWQHDGSRIDDPDELPAKWDPNEYDLDENDIDGNIARCHLRIEENILPKMFQERLDMYMRRKAKKDAIIDAAPGLPWKVARRLNVLRAIEADLAENDVQDQMSNVQAIIAAYNSEQLKWKRGTVTFWSNGKMVWGPGKFDWETFSTVNKEHQGHKSFWVEECKSDSETLLRCWGVYPNDTHGLHTFSIRLKIPGVRNPFATRRWDFLDDTAASSMTIFACDLAQLEQAANAKLQVYGYSQVATASGEVSMPAYHLQALVADTLAGGNNYMIPWTDIKVYVMPGEPSKALRRLSGIWIRHLLYFANVPDNSGNMYLSESKAELVKVLPNVDVTQAKAPRWDDFPMDTSMSDSDEMDTTED